MADFKKSKKNGDVSLLEDLARFVQKREDRTARCVSRRLKKSFSKTIGKLNAQIELLQNELNNIKNMNKDDARIVNFVSAEIDQDELSAELEKILESRPLLSEDPESILESPPSQQSLSAEGIGLTTPQQDIGSIKSVTASPFFSTSPKPSTLTTSHTPTIALSFVGDHPKDILFSTDPPEPTPVIEDYSAIGLHYFDQPQDEGLKAFEALFVITDYSRKITRKIKKKKKKPPKS